MRYLIAGTIVLAAIGAGVWWYVANQDQAYSVLIDSPTSGDTLTLGKKSEVTWHTYNFKKIDPMWVSNVSVVFTLVPANQTLEEARNGAPIYVTEELPFTEKGAASFTVPKTITPGPYKVSMNLHGINHDVPNPLWGMAFMSDVFAIK